LRRCKKFFIATRVTHRCSGRSALQHQIEHTDRKTGQLVYELYGLSDEEIALVEAATL
jgi:hypothetical protein